jgi:hypothetical protein
MGARFGHKAVKFLGFGNGSYRTKAVILIVPVVGRVRHRAVIDIKVHAWEYTGNKVQHIPIFVRFP